MDSIFGASNFRNEIIWLRSRNPKGSQHASKKFSPSTDTILYYAKSDAAPFYEDAIRVPLSQAELLEKYDRSDELGPYADGPILRSASMGVRPNLVYEYKGFTPPPYGWRVELEKLREIDAGAICRGADQARRAVNFGPLMIGETLSAAFGVTYLL
ncbi:hypothetical protein [Sinorhizobium psoraleae]|uniref:Uncharacterized protein n=1 Tax=Sinorhizobium psoraleae TaxID=520838 RepID=A0ABT4KNV9_9HYPH|nr:hypothetical protein [Sinorhizobium psoraleae]MCZ4093599.1 hypothetical protein [Sinorhizobium psoraleae]